MTPPPTTTDTPRTNFVNDKQDVPQSVAPRLDLDVPHELCERTLVELIRRRWTQRDIAAYVGSTSKADVAAAIQAKLSERQRAEYDGQACGATGEVMRVLWYADPNKHP